MPSGKSLTDEENAKLKLIVAQMKEEYRVQQALADDLEVSQQMISQFLAPHGKAGVSFATKVAKLRGYKTYADMLGPESVSKYGESPSWIENEPEARKQLPMPEAAYRLARDTPAYVGRTTYTPSLIAATVQWRWQMASDEEKTKAEERQIKAEIDSEKSNVTKIHARPRPASPKRPNRPGSPR